MDQETLEQKIIIELEKSKKSIDDISAAILNLRKMDVIKGGGVATKEKKDICIHKENIYNHLIAMYWHILHLENEIFSKFDIEFNKKHIKLCSQPHLQLNSSNINELKQKARIMYSPIIKVTADVYLNAFDKNNKQQYVFDNIKAMNTKDLQFVEYCKEEMLHENNEYLYSSCSKPDVLLTGRLANGIVAEDPLQGKDKEVLLNIKNKTITQTKS